MSFLLVFEGIFETITSVIGTLLYPMFSVIFLFVDIVQSVFNAFAGIGDINFDGEQIHAGGQGGAFAGMKNGEGIVYYLMQNEIVTNLLYSIMLLALLLIVIFTTMAFLKNLYVSKPKKWQEIIGSSIKGLANFIFLPVCCLLGVWMGNILLQAINGATSSSGATQMSRKLFICCAYNANLYRSGGTDTRSGELARKIVMEYGDGSAAAGNIPDGETPEYYAAIVDNVYAESDKVSIHWWDTVDDGYSLWQINYVILIAGGIFMMYVLGSLAFGMVKRLFYLLVLFVISPAICALYPLDDGSAVKSWSGEFKKQVLSAYGAVAGMNIFFSLLPLAEKIQIDILGGLAHEIVRLFIIISGLLIVKDLIGLITGYVGGDNAFASGSTLMKGAHGQFKKHVGNAATKATNVYGTFAKAHQTKKAGGSWWGSMGDSVGKGILGNVNKTIKEFSGIDIAENHKKTKGLRKEGKAEGSTEKNAREFNEKFIAAAAKKDAAEAQYQGLKNNIAHGDHSEESRNRLAKYKKELDAANNNYYKTIDEAPGEIRQQVMDKLGKKQGISGAEFDKLVQRDREFYRTKTKAEESSAKLAGADDKIDALFDKIKVSGGDGEDWWEKQAKAVKEEFNVDMEPIVKALDMSFQDLAQYLKSGAHLDVDKIDFSSVSGADRVKIESAAAVFNRRVDKEQSQRDAWQGDMDAYAKMAAKMAKEMQASGTSKVSIEDDDIKRLSEAIKEGNKLDGESEKIIQAISADGKKREQSVHGVLKDLSEIRKLLEDARKK